MELRKLKEKGQLKNKKKTIKVEKQKTLFFEEKICFLRTKNKRARQ